MNTSSLQKKTYPRRNNIVSLRSNKKTKAFWSRLLLLSRTKDKTALSEWKFKRCYTSNEKQCICGHRIKKVFVIHNDKTNKLTDVGSCCIKRLGICFRWQSKADYLNSALLLSKSDSEKTFVTSLIDKLPKWGSRLLVTDKQKAWLERITNHKWRWTTWETRYQRYPNQYEMGDIHDFD